MMWAHKEEVQEFLLDRSGLPLPQVKVESSTDLLKTRVEADGDTIMVAANVHS